MSNHLSPPESSQEPTGMRLHMGIVEQGKLYALAGDHRKALFYYRHGMQMSVEAGDPEVFFRHYLECVIDSLEQTESYAEVLEYCERAIQLYADNPPETPVALMDLATIYQRKGVTLMKSGDSEQALDAFQTALQIAGQVGKITSKTLPLTQTLLQWLRSRYHIDKQRIVAEQNRVRYFIVRKDTVDPSMAVKLPNENIPGF